MKQLKMKINAMNASFLTQKIFMMRLKVKVFADKSQVSPRTSSKLINNHHGPAIRGEINNLPQGILININNKLAIRPITHYNLKCRPQENCVT